MNKIKLSDRAAILLVVVVDYTERDSAGGLTAFWCPHYSGRNSSRTLGGFVYASGSGDAASLRGMERRGLILSHPNVGRYTFSTTPDGAAYFEREIRGTGRLETLRKIVAENTRIMNGGARGEAERAAEESAKLIDILAPHPIQGSEAADPCTPVDFPAPSPWRSTPNALRIAKTRHVTLTPEAHAALDATAEAHHGGNASECVCAAVLAYARERETEATEP